MATSIAVNGKTIKRPGVYALTESGIKYPPQNLSYGNICIIDSGLGAGFAGGAGVNGASTQGVDSVYEINTIQQYRAFMKGGALWDLGESLFKPSKNNYPGVSKVFYVKAATTTAASISLSLLGGSITFTTRDEGEGANGVVVGGKVTQGYGALIVPGVINPSAFMIKFYGGTYTGIDAENNVPFDGVSESNVAENVLFTSPEVTSLQQLVDWCNASTQFKAVFSAPQIVSEDPGYAGVSVGIVLAAGGTEAYDTASFNAALTAVKDLDNTFFLSLESGEDARSLNNTKILDFIENESKYEKFLVVAGGEDKGSFLDISVDTALYYNSDKVIVVHGGYKKNTRRGVLLKSSLHKAARVLGRLCGLPPQTPITFKDIDIDGEKHRLDDDEKELALDRGVLTTHYDNELGYYVIQQGINTLQQNTYLVNDDATSHDIAVKRIAAQLNKEIIVNAKKTFFGKNVGPNRGTMTEDDVKAWLEGFLQKKVASTLDDNLIIRFENIQVVVEQDNYFINYSFVPNYPISKMVFTGIILEK